MIAKILKFVFILFFLINCATQQTQVTEEENKNPNLEYFYPANKTDLILDEKGNEVKVTSEDDIFFQKPSDDEKEYFRVILTSEGYLLRQIRGSEFVSRNVDLDGDKLISENLKKYNKVNFLDYGVIKVDFHQESMTVKSVRFNKAPRINEIAKIIQDDITRWKIDFLIKEDNDNDIQLSEIIINYKVILKKETS